MNYCFQASECREHYCVMCIVTNIFVSITWLLQQDNHYTQKATYSISILYLVCVFLLLTFFYTYILSNSATLILFMTLSFFIPMGSIYVSLICQIPSLTKPYKAHLITISIYSSTSYTVTNSLLLLFNLIIAHHINKSSTLNSLNL